MGPFPCSDVFSLTASLPSTGCRVFLPFTRVPSHDLVVLALFGMGWGRVRSSSAGGLTVLGMARRLSRHHGP